MNKYVLYNEMQNDRKNSKTNKLGHVSNVNSQTFVLKLNTWSNE